MRQNVWGHKWILCEIQRQYPLVKLYANVSGIKDAANEYKSRGPSECMPE